MKRSSPCAVSVETLMRSSATAKTSVATTACVRLRRSQYLRQQLRGRARGVQHARRAGAIAHRAARCDRGDPLMPRPGPPPAEAAQCPSLQCASSSDLARSDASLRLSSSGADALARREAGGDTRAPFSSAPAGGGVLALVGATSAPERVRADCKPAMCTRSPLAPSVPPLSRGVDPMEPMPTAPTEPMEPIDWRRPNTWIPCS